MTQAWRAARQRLAVVVPVCFSPIVLLLPSLHVRFAPCARIG
jgi:hypothetical protein